MQVKQRLQISTSLSALSVLVVLLLLLVTTVRVHRALTASDTADAILAASFERLILRTDLFRTGGERAKIQLIAKHAQISSLLKTALTQFPDPEDQKTLRELIALQDSIRKFSKALRLNREKRGRRELPDQISLENEDRLLSQLNMRVYEAILLDTKLQASSAAWLSRSLKQGGGGIVLVLLLLSAVSLINSVTMHRAIAARIRRLRDGTAVIGDGDLSHRIEISSNDEFAELARSFNEMTSRLGASYLDLEREIEERKRVEEGLRATTAELRAANSELWSAQSALGSLMREQSIILENVPIGISKIVDRKQVWVNRWIEKMFQYTRDEMVFRTTRTLYPSEEAYRKVRDEAYAVLAEGGIYETEQELLRKDGARILVRYIGSALDPNDMEKGVLWLMEDVTERRRAQESLRRSEEKLMLALQSANMGVWRLDLKEQKRFLDDQVCHHLGLDPAVFSGSAEEFFAAVHPDDRDKVAASLERTVSSGEPYQIEYRALWPDGQIRYVAARGRVARDAAGSPLWVDGLLWDITERKQAEDALHAAHDELAKQMEVRTRELREKEVMLKEIHHRVKNNLQVVSSLVSLQADSCADRMVHGVLQEVTHRVRSMALVHEKLYQSESLALVDFADYSQSLLHYLWQGHGHADAVQLSLELDHVSLPVDTAIPCGLILNELAGNALKHAFAGRDSGMVTVVLRDCGDGSAVLAVRDDGVGLPPDLDWRRTASLGLQLVLMLAGQLSGTVAVDRSGGTGFEISFPVAPQADKGGARA